MKLLCYFVCFIILPGCLWQSVKPPEPVVVVAPTSVTTTIDPADSSYLRITSSRSWDTTDLPQKSDNLNMADNGNDYSISLLGKSFSHVNLDSVDSFLLHHKASIDTNKVIIHNRPGAPAVIFEKLTNVLKKSGIMRFRLVTY